MLILSWFWSDFIIYFLVNFKNAKINGLNADLCQFGSESRHCPMITIPLASLQQEVHSLELIAHSWQGTCGSFLADQVKLLSSAGYKVRYGISSQLRGQGQEYYLKYNWIKGSPPRRGRSCEDWSCIRALLTKIKEILPYRYSTYCLGNCSERKGGARASHPGLIIKRKPTYVASFERLRTKLSLSLLGKMLEYFNRFPILNLDSCSIYI